MSDQYEVMVLLLPAAVLGGADCEQLRSGWLAQPANAVSSVAYVVAGLALLRTFRPEPVRRRLLRFGTGLAMVATGAGSVAYHGPQPRGADTIHNAAIVTLAVVLVAALASRPGLGPAARTAWRRSVICAMPALVAYAAGRTGSVLCRPGLIWQPHAVWHILSAGALYWAAVALTGPRDWREPELGGTAASDRGRAADQRP